MKKRVLIVEPSASRANVFSFYSYLPLMGPMYLGTILKENGFDVTVINENLLKDKLHGKDFDVDFLLLSCLTPTVTRGYKLAKMFKELNPDGKVVMGGPHVTFMKEEAAQYSDYVVMGEGENVIVDLLKYGSGEKFIQGTPVKDMDTLPMIDWNILQNNEKGNIMPIMTSRGCPFACNFCSVTGMFGRGYRAMSPERVVEEVKTSRKRYIFFYDDNFTADVKRAHKVMDRLIDIKVKPKTWTTQVRSDVCNNPDMVEKLARSGCEKVCIGFESINPKTLKTMKKSQTPEDISKAIQVLHSNDIGVHGMFIYGSDSDDPEVIKATDDFVKKTRIDTVQYTLLTPFPGTELFERMVSEERLIHLNWEFFDGLHVVFWPEQFSPVGLQQFALDSFASFYSLTNAANEVINLCADKVMKSIDWIANKSRARRYCFRNAFFKAGGSLIISKWHKINESYMTYLYQLSQLKTPQDAKKHLARLNPTT